MSNILNFLRHLIKPFLTSGLEAQRHYLDVAEQIVIYRNAEAARPYHRLLCLAAFLILQCLYHCFAYQSDMNAIISADIWYFYARGFQLSMNIGEMLVVLNGAYYYWSFYLNANPELIEHYRALLFEPHNYRWLYKTFRGESCPDKIRKFASVLMNILRAFYLIVFAAWIFFISLFVGAISTNRGYFFGTVVGFCGYLMHWICLIACCLAVMAFAFVCVQVLAITMAGLRALHIHARQHNHLLEFCRDPVTAVSIFIVHDIHLFRSIFMANRAFGRLLLCFLLLHSPINAFAVVMLLTGSLADPFSRLFCGIFVFAELVGILAAHLYIASLTDRIYRSASLLLRIAAAEKVAETQSKQFRLRLSLTIERLHTKKRIGINYGHLGLVTVATFAKCLALYCQFLIYLHQLMRKY